ncbi:MAG: hypothetical protein WC315_08780 [Candidatus Omnitrophota bacterium]
MKRVVMIVAGIVFLSGECRALEPVWKEVSRGIVNVRTVLVKSENPKVIYIGTDRGVYKTQDGGNSWRNVFSIRGDNHNINYLAASAFDKSAIYAATGGGLFISVNGGQRWSRLFRGRNSSESDCSVVLSVPDKIYLGTKSGLFISKDNGRSWHKEPGKLGDSQIYNVAYNHREPKYLYISCADGVFKSSDCGTSWERIYITHPTENSVESEEENEDRDEEERRFEVRYVAVDPNKPDDIYLATSRGVYLNETKANEWKSLSEFGLFSHDVKFLAFSDKSELYAVAKSGIFVYRPDGWRELSFNLSARQISFLTLDEEGNLYACTEKGLFKSGLDYAGDSLGADVFAEYCKAEPNIKDVQRQAIKYAEVGPDKIINWRKQAQKKALLPKLTVGLDGSKKTNYEIYTGANTSYIFEGPNDKSNGWDVALSWDFGELIWNSDQTSIDTRSRLMVQLRGDILDEVNKLYFERIRVKMELDRLQIEDRKRRFEKELRVRELTASLDALTGGYFSSQIQANKNKV